MIKITNPSIEIIKPTSYDLVGIKKHIEKCGRVCYKSEGNITENSYEKFINMLINSGHTSVLEHGTVYLTIPVGRLFEEPEDTYIYKQYLIKYFKSNKYSVVSLEKEDNGNILYFITTNYRVLINMENEYSLESIFKYISEPTLLHEKRITVRFDTQIAISREFNRHRVNSVSEQSTRYCNFSKDKFENKLNISLPSNITDEDIDSADMKVYYDVMEHEPSLERKIYSWKAIDWWIWANKCAEVAYMKLIECGWKPQQARTILPLDTSTELVHTAFFSDWMNFLKLRSPEMGAKGVHPDAAVLADKLYDILITNYGR